MAKKKINSKQLQMSFNLPARTKNTASDAFKKATQSVKSYGQKAAENVSKKAPSTAVVKSGTNYPAVKSNKSTAVAKPNNSSKAPAVVKPKVTISSKKVSDGIYSKQFPKYTKYTDVTKKAKDIKGKAMLAVYGAAALTAAAAAASGAFDKKKGTAIKAGAKKAASTVKKPDTKKVETKKPDTKTTPEKTTPKKVTAIKDAAKKAAESSTKTSNPKFVKGYVEGLERPGAKKAAPKKPVTSSKVIGAVKATVTGKNTTKIETNLKKPATKTNTKVDNTSIEQKAKDVMRGKYGSGADRKKALGGDYDKVQAIINKQMAGSKAKSTPAKTTEAAPERMEIKKAQPIEYTGPKELAMTAEQKMNANIDKSKKEKMRKGGMVKSKRK
jgi:hypothetical protein